MLAGRDSERSAIAALLDAARNGSGGALVVRGVAGSGKSSLLREAAAATDLLVVSTSGVESESPLAFAALQRLLWPLRNRLHSLPGPQSKALQAALGEAEGEGDRFLTFLGTLSLLADVAEERPVLAVVDDAHWLDEASSAALLFVARRLQAERVALLFAARDGEAYAFDAPGLPTLDLGGIAGDDATGLLSEHSSGPIDPAVRDRLVDSTGGNPLALVELAGVLTADQLAGRDPLPTPLPLTGGVERGFLDRYRRLGEQARRFLLSAAADDTGRLTIVREAARRLGAEDDASQIVERAGLVRVDGDVLTLYHPLVRSAVYGSATSAQRRAAHLALAEVLAGDPDRQAWHLAAAADRPDERIVSALDAVAERAVARGGHEAAAAAWSRAAELTVESEARGRRLYLASSSAWLGASPSRAAALARAAAAEVTEPLLRIRLLTLQGQIEWNTRSLNDGYELILQAAQLAAGVDEESAQQLAMLAAALAAFGARSGSPVDPAALVRRPSADDPAASRAAYSLLQGYLAAAHREWRTAADEIRAALALATDAPFDPVLQPNLGIASALVDEDEHALRLHEQQLSSARRLGALSLAEHALTRGFHSQIATGAWAKAASAAGEALHLAASTGHQGLTALPTAELALVAALRGNDAAADRHLGDAAEISAGFPMGITDGLVADLMHWARGLRAMARPATALHHFERIAGPGLRRMAAPDVFDAALRADRRDVARSWLGEVARFAVGTGRASAVAVTEHGRGMLAEEGDADTHFKHAVEAHADSPRLPDRARTLLVYGEYLRRARRRVDAREHLRAALALFEELGAAPLADRAAQELRASGERARRRDVTTAAELTQQERQVAALVRQGLSNRDAAAQLFLSPRTVDFHLRNVFSKLGVTSRAELAALPLDL